MRRKAFSLLSALALALVIGVAAAAHSQGQSFPSAMGVGETAVSPTPIANGNNFTYTYGVELTPGWWQSAYPGETVIYTHTATNIGNGSDIFDITSTEALPIFMTSVEPESLSLDPGESKTITVTVTVADTALSGEWADIVVAATPQTDPTVTAVAINTVTVNAVYGVQIEPGGAQSADPGQTAVYTHLITNTGNIADTYTIAANSPSFPASLSVDSLTLQPGESDTLIVTVTVPTGTAAGTTGDTTITVFSDNASAVEATNTTTANQVAALSITPNPPAAQQVFPGDWATYTHTVANLGNGSDTFTFIAENSDPAFTVIVTPDSLVLNAGNSDVVTVAVQAPAGAMAGDSNQTTVTAVSTFNPAITQSAINTTTVKTAGVLLGPDQAKTVSPGRSIVYTLTLTNTGNLTDTFTLAREAEGFPTHLEPISVTVGAGKTAVISVTITAPRQVASGTKDVATISATSANRPSVSDSATLTSTVTLNTVGEYNLFLPVVQRPGEWQSVGTNWPADRRAYSIAVCATDESRVFAGTNNGLYRLSSNGTWTQVSGGNLPPGSLALSVVMSADCNTIYAGFETAGVWKSANGGTSWSKVGTLDRVEKLVLLQGDRLFALSDVEIYYWDNGWLPVTAAGSRFGSSDRPVRNIYAFSPEGPLYAVQWFEGSIWHNPNPLSNPRNGWSLFPNLLQTGDIAMRYVAGDAAGPRFIGTVNNHYARQGNNWARVQSFGARSFALDGVISFTGYTGMQGVYLSYNDAVFTPLNQGWGNNIPNTVFDLHIHQKDLYSATSTGVWVYRNYP